MVALGLVVKVQLEAKVLIGLMACCWKQQLRVLWLAELVVVGLHCQRLITSSDPACIFLPEVLWYGR